MIAQVEFAKDDVPRVIALIVGMAQAAYAFAPAVCGVMLTTLAGNDPQLGRGTGAFFIAAVALQSIAIGCFAAGRTRHGRDPRK